MSNGQAGGAVPTSGYLGYLESGRADLYEEKSSTEEKPHPEGSGEKFKHTVLVVIVSVAFFILVISWSNVLQSYYDSLYVDPVIEKQLQARLLTALTITAGAVLVIMTVFIFWS